ncbi:hypothetical protein BGY98DRAFT_936381 [Russula aff. rugulosa BPL654]|nr:hypothetical protein BGY98DRAFT_936381 [Russula aff. rugulosa BPL654]
MQLSLPCECKRGTSEARSANRVKRASCDKFGHIKHKAYRDRAQKDYRRPPVYSSERLIFDPSPLPDAAESSRDPYRACRDRLLQHGYCFHGIIAGTPEEKTRPAICLTQDECHSGRRGAADGSDAITLEGNELEIPSHRCLRETVFMQDGQRRRQTDNCTAVHRNSHPYNTCERRCDCPEEVTCASVPPLLSSVHQLVLHIDRDLDTPKMNDICATGSGEGNPTGSCSRLKGVQFRGGTHHKANIKQRYYTSSRRPNVIKLSPVLIRAIDGTSGPVLVEETQVIGSPIFSVSYSSLHALVALPAHRPPDCFVEGASAVPVYRQYAGGMLGPVAPRQCGVLQSIDNNGRCTTDPGLRCNWIRSLARWLLPCPDATVAPGDYFIWKRNDGALRYFIQSHVSPADVHLIELLPTAHLMFDTLRSKHEQQGTFAQINLLLKALQIQLTREKPIRDSIAEMRTYYRRIVAMGKPKEDDIFAVILLNSMDKHLGPLQQTVNSMSSSSPNFNSEMIVSYLLATDNLVRHRVELGYPANPYTLSSSLAPSSAFAAISSRPHPLRPVCSNCKRGNHTTEFCISPGGKWLDAPLVRLALHTAQH